jgi:two-component system sensor histidine kinase RpfC
VLSTPSVAAWIATSFRNAARVNRDEIEQSLYRLLFVSLFIGYLLIDGLWNDAVESHAGALLLATTYLLVAVAIFYTINRSPEISHARHTATMVTDISVTTGCLYLAGATGSFFYVIYLWLSIGNGFRYGLRYLYLCMVLSVLAFGGLIYTSDYWAQHHTLGVGLLIGLAVLPVFSSALVHRLNRALRRSEEASKAKSQFVANMSHELRTPLNGVVGMTHLLMKTPLAPVAKEYARAILASSRTLLSLIDNILDLSKIEAGKIELESVDVDLYGLLHSVHSMFAQQAQERGLRLMLHVDPATPATMRGDPTYIRQVLVNLVGNAIKFTERGYVDIQVRLITVDKDKPYMRFEIVDTGIGIPREALAGIFEMFTQADASTTRKFGGSGLGTTIAKQLVERMGGTIDVSSVVGEGTRFYFDIPFMPAVSDAVSEQRLGARVLVVGTLPAERFAQHTLTDQGAAVAYCLTSEQAFDALASAANRGEPYHAVVVNEVDCDLDAVEFVSAVRRVPLHVHLTAILLSRYTDARGTAEQLRAGYSYVLSSQVTPAIARNLLRYVCTYNKPDDNDDDWNIPGKTSLRVLAAEDNPTNQMVIRSILEQAGHEATVVSDGEEALDALESGQFDIAVIDMQMPKMSGVNVIKFAKWTLPPERQLPFIVLTANATKMALDECIAAGASAFVTKPIEPKRLLLEIEALARRSGHAGVTRRDVGAGGTVATSSGVTSVFNQAPLNDIRSLGQTDDPIPSIVGMFEKDTVRILDQMREALGAARFADFREYAHSLKGSASSVGAMQMHKCCASVEEMDDQYLAVKASAVMHDMVDAFQAAQAALAGYLTSPPVSGYGSSRGRGLSRRQRR